MRNSQKNGLLKSLTAMLIVVLAVALTLTGCSDKVARERANQALTAAQNAQDAADKAQTSANNAQDKADGAQDSADANKDAIDSLPDSGAVAEVVKTILNQYVKGAELTEDSIITMAELETFLASDEVATLLAQYVTIDALADYAKAADLNGLREQFQTALEQVTTALGTYVTKSAYDLDKATITGAIESLSTNLTKALNAIENDLATKAELAALKTEMANTLTETVKNYYTKTEVDTLVGRVEDLIGDIDFNDLITDLQAYADAAVLDSSVQYEAATVEVIKAINKINADLAVYATIKNSFDEDEYNKMLSKYEDTKLELLRAQRVDSLKDENGNVIIKGVNDIVADAEKWVDENVDNLGRELYKALEKITYPIIVPVPHITAEADGYVSLDEINACWAIVEQAKTQLTEGSDAYNLVMTVNGEFLPELVQVAQDTYDNLVAARDDAYGEAANSLVNSILAIPAYADITVDRLDARAALKAAVEYVSNITYHEWKQHYFVNDETNVNIDRILGVKISEAADAPTVLDYYMDAIAKDVALDKLAAEAVALNAEIVETLTAKGWYANGYILYSDYEVINTLNTKVAEWIATNKVTTPVNVLPNYADLTADNGAYKYAVRMNNAYNKAAEENGLIAKIDAALALDLVLDSKATIVEAYEGIAPWVTEFAVDDANKAAILNLNNETRVADITAAYERMAVLTEAAANVGAVNEMIAALIKVEGENKKFNGNINSMSAIRDVRNAIVTWLNTYDIVPSADDNSAIAKWIRNANAEYSDVELEAALKAADAEYLAANYNMLNHADLDFVIAAYNQIVLDAIADAKANVMPKIDLVDANDPKMLYQFKNIMTALNAYYAWVAKYNVIDPDITHLDFGEGDAGQEAENILVPNYLALMNAYAKYLEVAKAAHEGYKVVQAAYEELVKITTVTVKDGAVIKDAYNKVSEWKTTYLDDAREGGAWNDVILAIIADIKSEELVEKATYDAIVEVYNAYEALVTEAVNAGNAIKAELDAIVVNVYNGDKIAKIATDYAAWATKYGIVLDDYAGTALDARLTFMKADVIDAQATKQSEYNTLVAAVKAGFATIKSGIDALNIDNFNIYAAELVKPLREAYETWVKTTTLTDNTTGAYTAEIDDAEILSYKATLEKLIAAEAAVKAIEDAKKAETETVKGIIDALPAADKVTTADRAAIEAARAAYDKWFNGDNNALKAIDTTKDNAAYGYDLTEELAKLLAVENKLARLDQMLEEAFAAIDAAAKKVENVVPTDANSVADAEDAINDAYELIEEFYAANGGTNNGAITETTMEYLSTLAAAKMKLAAKVILNDATVKANAKYEDIAKDVNAALKSGLNQLAATTLAEYEAYFATTDKVAIDLFELYANNVANGMAHVVENYTNA